MVEFFVLIGVIQHLLKESIDIFFGAVDLTTQFITK